MNTALHIPGPDRFAASPEEQDARATEEGWRRDALAAIDAVEAAKELLSTCQPTVGEYLAVVRLCRAAGLHEFADQLAERCLLSQIGGPEIWTVADLQRQLARVAREVGNA